VSEGDLNPGTGEISLNLDLNSKTGENPRIEGLMRLSLHPPATVATAPGNRQPVRGPEPDERAQGYVK
jgi:hypothetical protein